MSRKLQLCAAFVAALGGAYLIGMWVVGLVLIAFGAVAGVDALLRDVPRREMSSALDQWRQTR